MVSTPDQQYDNAPSITLEGAGAGTGAQSGSSEQPSQPTPSGTPSITGPSSVSAGDPAPSFVVDTAGAPYYIVEVATEAFLLDGTNHDGDRTADNFYATWQDSDLQTGSTYQLPEAAWQRLSQGQALYHRIGTTTSETGWENYTVSVGDTDYNSAPSILIDASSRQVRSVATPAYARAH